MGNVFVTNNSTLKVDRGLTPTRVDNPDIFNGQKVL